MTHISYLQSLPNPSSAGSETDYCFQTPEERGAERGGGWRGERDASVIEYTDRLRGLAHVCEHAHMCMCAIISRADIQLQTVHPFALFSSFCSFNAY